MPWSQFNLGSQDSPLKLLQPLRLTRTNHQLFLAQWHLEFLPTQFPNFPVSKNASPTAPQGLKTPNQLSSPLQGAAGISEGWGWQLPGQREMSPGWTLWILPALGKTVRNSWYDTGMWLECGAGSPPSLSLIKEAHFYPTRRSWRCALPVSLPQEQQDRFPGSRTGSVFPAHCQPTLMDPQEAVGTP